MESVESEKGVNLAGRMGSNSALIYQGMRALAQHQQFVNETWMESCLYMLQKYAESQ